MLKLIKLIVLSMLLLTFSIIYANEDSVGDEIGVWYISNGKLISNDVKEDKLAHANWNEAYKILPKELIDEYVRSLRLYTDGKGNDLGGMNQLDDSNSNWQFDLDVKDMKLLGKKRKEIIDSTHTLIHEFGHLLTLNIDQIIPYDSDPDAELGDYFTSEGDALKSSYMEKFINKFWNEDLLDEWFEIDENSDEDERLDMLYEFYLDNELDFVSDYAAESPEEDIAESWTFFVLTDKPRGRYIKEQKVRFFYRFPELVEYRDHIRKNIRFIPENYLETFGE